MGRNRKTDKHLPTNVYLRSGTYYFVERDSETGKQKWIRLARDFGEAMIEYGKIVEAKDCRNMGDVLDRYLREVSPKKAPSTYKKEQKQIALLKKTFGHMQPDNILEQAIYRYMDLRGKHAPVAANRDLSVLSDAFKKAIRWGAATKNPCLGIERFEEVPRERYVTDDELNAFAQYAGDDIAAYIEFKYLTGLRKGDILSLRLSDFNDDGIHLTVQKTKKKLIIEWTEALRDSVKRIRSLKRPVNSIFLFCTRRGQKYSTDGFSSIWKRKMVKALEQGVLAERFAEHDIRAKTASDIEADHATDLLAHADRKTTERVYRRKPQRVSPLR